MTTQHWRTNSCGRGRRIPCCSGKKRRGFRWLKTWLEQHFRATEALGANSDDVAVWELVGLWQVLSNTDRRRSIHNR